MDPTLDVLSFSWTSVLALGIRNWSGNVEKPKMKIKSIAFDVFMCHFAAAIHLANAASKSVSSETFSTTSEVDLKLPSELYSKASGILNSIRPLLSSEFAQTNTIMEFEYSEVLSEYAFSHFSCSRYFLVNAQLLSFVKARTTGTSPGLCCKLLSGLIAHFQALCIGINESKYLVDLSMSFKQHLEYQLKYHKSMLYVSYGDVLEAEKYFIMYMSHH